MLSMLVGDLAFRTHFALSAMVNSEACPGLFTPNAGQHFRDEQRRRRSQFDRGTRHAALEEFDYDNSTAPTIQGMYPPH